MFECTQCSYIWMMFPGSIAGTVVDSVFIHLDGDFPE